ncbi:MAG TPA: ribonuclease P protein component [Sulfurospirillum cavolei]|uniref:Ribonuclease P protein component n=1 Tax=Sulfurospirillum cavolei TaxID=366522 RepID=A0A2D3WE11_9BACT|nr:ribonuclease P protein component [Sulfurospirillum cavolei]DAB37320.1 MAG TPA: ribonuclease P protein component [Sulfurospirillum cavolei]
MGRLRAYETLKETREYSYIYNHGKKWHYEGALVFYLNDTTKRVGFTASKKVGNAIKRNLAKRRLRAIFLDIQPTLNDGVYVFVAKEKIHQLSYEALKKGIIWSIKKLNCVKE